MNPSDALPQDWRMYYHNCWMEHTTLGIGMVAVSDNRLYFYNYQNGDSSVDPVKVNAQDLKCWWPRPGAYNTKAGSAVYISRKAIRTMRKSAVAGEHYVIKWGPRLGNIDLMVALRAGPSRHSISYAAKVLKDGLVASVAVSRDLILAKDKFNNIVVIFRGLEAGEYRDGEFVPSFTGSPLAKRVMMKLTQEELRCELT